MMSKTHLAVGIAGALAVAAPSSLEECLAPMLGGAVGSLVCDIDVKSNRHPKSRDALHGRYIAAGLAAAILLLDLVSSAGIWSSALDRPVASSIVGAVILVVTGVLARTGSHRGFSHSLLALVMFCLGMHLLCPVLTVGFVAGFLSHVLLDFSNKKPVQFLFPRSPGFHLGWFPADGAANVVFLVVGLLFSAALLVGAAA